MTAEAMHLACIALDAGKVKASFPAAYVTPAHVPAFEEAETVLKHPELALVLKAAERTNPLYKSLQNLLSCMETYVGLARAAWDPQDLDQVIEASLSKRFHTIYSNVRRIMEVSDHDSYKALLAATQE